MCVDVEDVSFNFLYFYVYFFVYDRIILCMIVQ